MGMKFIVLVVIVLAVIAVAQIMRVYELSRKVTGKREEDIDLRTNNINASLMLVFLIVFFGSFIFMLTKYGNGMLPSAASELGEEIEWLFNLNWVIVILIFFVTNALLFGFAWKYAYNPDRKANWFPHDNRLEMIWTVVPGAVLAVIIILGLMTWNNITGPPSDNARIIEIYGEQFTWSARYSGDDNKLGYSDYKLTGSSTDRKTDISYNNPLGVVTSNSIQWGINKINNEIGDLHEKLDEGEEGKTIFSVAKTYEMVATVEKLERIRERVLDMEVMYGDSVNKFAKDDFITKELFFVKGQEHFLVLRSKDVLHSAYFPHFRAQMNVIPGQFTSLKITPTKTTAEMRVDRNNPDFNFVLMCNKICGESHYLMNMIVVVGTEEEYQVWKTAEGSLALDDTKIAPTGLDKAYMVMPEIGHGHDDHGDQGEHHEEEEQHEEGASH